MEEAFKLSQACETGVGKKPKPNSCVPVAVAADTSPRDLCYMLLVESQAQEQATVSASCKEWGLCLGRSQFRYFSLSPPPLPV